MSDGNRPPDVSQQLVEMASAMEKNAGRIGNLESRADKAEIRADESEARADRAEARADRAEVQAYIDRQLVAELKAQGVVRSEHEDQLEQALKSSRTIGTAVGMVMQAMGVDADTAFSVLSRLSQTNNRKVRDLAAELAASGDLGAVLKRR